MIKRAQKTQTPQTATASKTSPNPRRAPYVAQPPEGFYRNQDYTFISFERPAGTKRADWAHSAAIVRQNGTNFKFHAIDFIAMLSEDGTGFEKTAELFGMTKKQRGVIAGIIFKYVRGPSRLDFLPLNDTPVSSPVPPMLTPQTPLPDNVTPLEIKAVDTEKAPALVSPEIPDFSQTAKKVLKREASDPVQSPPVIKPKEQSVKLPEKETPLPMASSAIQPSNSVPYLKNIWDGPTAYVPQNGEKKAKAPPSIILPASIDGNMLVAELELFKHNPALKAKLPEGMTFLQIFSGHNVQKVGASASNLLFFLDLDEPAGIRPAVWRGMKQSMTAALVLDLKIDAAVFPKEEKKVSAPAPRFS